MAHIVLNNIVKRYDDKQAVIHGIDLAIGDGEFVVFVGPSGCGKSTLLRMIAGLEDISDGELHIDGRLANDIAPAARGLAMVFQSYALYPHMTVFENMAFALNLAGHKKAEVRAAVERAAEILQITPLLKRKPKDLSGGQRQRVAIGRAIVRKPKVFLFDEPLSNLDASLRVQMRVEISRLHQELKTTMIYVTHDQVEAMTLGERIVVFNGGRIEQVGSPHELYNHPGNLFVAGFLGAPKMNFIACEVVACSRRTVAVRVPGGGVIEVEAQGDAVVPGERLTLGVRAEHISLREQADVGSHAENNVLDAAVSHVEYMGDVAIVYASMPGVAEMLSEMLAVKLPAEDDLRRTGETLRLYLPPQRCLLFDAKGQALAHTFAAPAQQFM
jgi:multiple sugar transport system ATP-binding protein